jgi:hypothetical protein
VQPVAGPLYDHLGLAGLGVLGDVGQALGDHEVGDRLDRGWRTARQVHGQPDRDRHPRRNARQRRVQAAVLQHGRVQAADQVAEFGQGRLGVLVGFGQGLLRLLGGFGVDPGQAQVHGQRDELLLGAVVQVPLQPAPFGVGGVDGAGPGLGQVLHLVFQFLRAAGAQQSLRDPGVERRDRGGQPRRRGQQHDPSHGEVHVKRDAEPPQDVSGRRRRHPAFQQAVRWQQPGVAVEQRADQARQPRRDGDDRGCRHRRGG